MTQKAVSDTIGISQKTLWEWGKDAEYREAYDIALQQTHSDIVPEALETVRRNLHCGMPAVEIGAAKIILERSQLVARQRLETTGNLEITVGVDDASD